MDFDNLEHYIVRTLNEISMLDSQTILLIVLVVVLVIVFDNFDLLARKKKKESGLSPQSTTVSIDGSKTIPVKEYISEKQRISGRPDALIVEDGFIIPVERKPLARKLHDRYIAQLLVYMRLVEEFEGKKPPYGYLILGPSCRRFKIDNSSARQAWLQGMLDEMQAVLSGLPAKPTPHPKKCSRCTVRSHCEFDSSSELVSIAPNEVNNMENASND